ncbi:cold shock domain-containing protein C2-like [Xenia sp. Carnegie-2017]|uniref:cold shock domain-containing protein C2-like n=1 Tax=Xenia sp. Carnegie-2017 TaxID=2897299 RepID=UPI001F0331AB|nr:cold shock domain-containing protein C2-like [Xenia sp. Carnegie-2017]XP_046855698.1 cold shock domain-containing protein C2-like [Xenia sp. Carnegie-2017]XP_046855699.1 cold shock domain-containing protein C2-like [Xenia sp. Carnegie-2017]
MTSSPEKEQKLAKGSEKEDSHFLVPSPIPTRRTRTTSQSSLAADSPLEHGTCKRFCRERGHGFITPDEGEKRDIFVHISDIEGEFVLKAGDRVKYRTVPLPPKCTEKQAVHVVITNAKGPHDTWTPLSHSNMSF